jgi:hypothetical protein
LTRNGKSVAGRKSPLTGSDHRVGGPAQPPAVYFQRLFGTGGVLISYFIDQYRLGALKGEKPADLPVQAPTE